MARRVVAGRDGVVHHDIGADKADLGIFWDLLGWGNLWPRFSSNLSCSWVRGCRAVGAVWCALLVSVRVLASTSPVLVA